MTSVAKLQSPLERVLLWLAVPAGIALVAGLGGWFRHMDRHDRATADVVLWGVVFVGVAAIGLNLLRASWKPKSPPPPKHGETCPCRECRRQRVLYGPDA